MNREDLSRLIRDHRRFPETIRTLLEGVDAELLRERPAAGKWSSLEILVHLRDEEIEDFRSRAQVAAESGHIEKGIDPEGWVGSRNYNAADGLQEERAAEMLVNDLFKWADEQAPNQLVLSLACQLRKHLTRISLALRDSIDRIEASDG